MQTHVAHNAPEGASRTNPTAANEIVQSAFQDYQIIRRNGAVVSFEPSKIAVALMKAFLAVHGTSGAASASVRETVDGLTETVVRALLRSRPSGGTFHIEDVQDHVELGLMRGGQQVGHRRLPRTRPARPEGCAQRPRAVGPWGPAARKADPAACGTARAEVSPMPASISVPKMLP